MEELPGQTSRQENKRRNVTQCTYTSVRTVSRTYVRLCCPAQSFDFSKIKIDPKTRKKLLEAEKHGCCQWELSKVSKENIL